jgi:hypothetical protein
MPSAQSIVRAGARDLHGGRDVVVLAEGDLLDALPDEAIGNDDVPSRSRVRWPVPARPRSGAPRVSETATGGRALVTTRRHTHSPVAAVNRPASLEAGDLLRVFGSWIAVVSSIRVFQVARLKLDLHAPQNDSTMALS